MSNTPDIFRPPKLSGTGPGGGGLPGKTSGCCQFFQLCSVFANNVSGLRLRRVSGFAHVGFAGHHSHGNFWAEVEEGIGCLLRMVDPWNTN